MTENLKMDVQSRLNDLEDAWFDRVDDESLRRIAARANSRRVKGAAEGGRAFGSISPPLTPHQRDGLLQPAVPSDAERDLRQLVKAVEMYKHALGDGCSACPARGDVCENTQGSCFDIIATVKNVNLTAIFEKWGGGR